MTKVTLIELVVDKNLNTKYEFFGEEPMKYTEFVKKTKDGINFMTFKKETTQNFIQEKYLETIKSLYPLENIETKILEKQENIKNCKWYNWHLPFLPTYWKSPKINGNKDISQPLAKGMVDFCFGTGIAMGIIESPLGWGILSLFAKGVGEFARRKTKKEQKKELDYLEDCQKKYLESKENIKDMEINIIQNEKAQKFINTYKNFELPDELENIKGLSKWGLIPIESINKYLKQIYSKNI